jgi:hypothetical protein
VPPTFFTRPARIAAVGLALAGIILGSGCTADVPTGETPMATETPATSTTPVADDEDLTPDTGFTALVVTPTTTPAPVLATDGKVHLAYELLLTNAAPVPYAMSSLEVIDPDSGDTLLTIGEDVVQRDVRRLDDLGEPLDASTGPARIGPAETWIAWIDVAVEPGAVPTELQHRTTGAVVTNAGSRPADYVLTTLAVSDAEAQVVASPVAAGDWYMSEGCCSNYTHHRNGFAPVNGIGQVPQRFAIDFYKVDEEGKTWEGDPSQLASYFSYRQPILAAASGTVVRSVDIFENTTALPAPPPIPGIIETVGNHVVVEIGPGRYLLYAHMDPGSVRVKVGDTVEVGEELGLVGSSGNSTTPHLHFQLQTEPTFFPTDGLPYVFDRFTLLGSVSERIWDDNLGEQPTGQLPFDKADPSERTNELPLDRTVVRFD